jgi:hypothetical protein
MRQDTSNAIANIMKPSGLTTLQSFEMGLKRGLGRAIQHLSFPGHYVMIVRNATLSHFIHALYQINNHF